MELEFFEDPQAFLDAAGGLLASDPVVGSVVASVTARRVRSGPEEREHPQWWVVVRAGGEPVGAAMRTASFKPYPLFFTPMPDEGARAIARALHERGEHPGGCNGALPAARVCAEEVVRLFGGGPAEVEMASRLWEATDVTVPPRPEGRLRRATAGDAELVLDWFTRFHAEADEQAGREPDPASGEHNTLDSVLRAVEEGAEWLWETDAGEVVHLTGRSLPSFGVSRIGPVFTPREHRGRGYASYVVGELTRRGLAEGTRMCLYTDQANPTSNRIYESLGYRPVCDQANIRVVAADN